MLSLIVFLLRRAVEVSTWLGAGIAAPALHSLAANGPHIASIVQAGAGLLAAVMPEDFAQKAAAAEDDAKARTAALVPRMKAGPDQSSPVT